MKEDDYYIDLNKDNFKVEILNIKAHPGDYKKPYSKIGILAGGLEFIEWGFKSDGTQILKFHNPANFSFIVKRLVIHCSLSKKEELFKNEDSRKFIIRAFNEDILSKFISAHPAGINSYDFQIVLLTSQKLLVCEILMEDGGQTLLRKIDDIRSDQNKLISVLKQTTNILYFIEKKKIWHNDVKLNNFLINEENLVRIIDFDVSSSALMDLTDSNGMIPNMKGCSSGYASPEAINFWKNQLMKLPPVGKMNPWKSDIYSWGMMALFLLKVV